MAAKSILVNNSRINETKKEGRSAVSLGLMMEDGTKEYANIFVGNQSLRPDKNTERLPDSQKKTYVYLSPENTYDVNITTKGQERKEQMTGQELIDANNAYMKDQRQARTAALEQSVGQAEPSTSLEAEVGD